MKTISLSSNCVTRLSYFYAGRFKTLEHTKNDKRQDKNQLRNRNITSLFEALSPAHFQDDKRLSLVSQCAMKTNY